MSIKVTKSSVRVINVRYSAFLGMLYVSTEESEAAIEQAKMLVGETEVKKGFTGINGDSATAKARKFLREAGCEPVIISGNLTSARIIDRELQPGRRAPYLTVGLRDDDAKIWLSIDANQPGAKMLARKLAYAEPGVDTEVAMFATYDHRPGADRAYGNHGVSLKQHGKEVRGINPKEALAPRIDAAVKALESAGIPMTDSETYARRKAAVELAFHLELMQEVEKTFAAHYAKRELPFDDGEAKDESTPPAEESVEGCGAIQAGRRSSLDTLI